MFLLSAVISTDISCYIPNFGFLEFVWPLDFYLMKFYKGGRERVSEGAREGATPPWIASTDVCLGPILSRWFPGADWGHLSILFSVFLVVLTISVEPKMLLWWSTCCLEVWLHDLPIGVSTVWCGLWCLSLLFAAGSRCYVSGREGWCPA